MNRAVISFVFLLLVSCTVRENADMKEKSAEEAVPAVCIWDGISVRKNPFRDAAVLSRLNLGEKVTYLGISAIDSTYRNQVYNYIRLSDERKAWVPAFSLVTGAGPAVVISETPVYRRPDLLTITNKTLGAMDIIAVTDTSDDWLSFYSAKKNQYGWIQSEAISIQMEDIAFSLYAGRILNEKSGRSLAEKIDSILNNNLYPEAVFVPIMKELREKERERIQIEDIMRQNIRQKDN